MLITCPAGPIAGTDADGVAVFRGIPYADSPTGHARFLPPRELAAWTAPFDATDYGPVAPQPDDPVLRAMFGADPLVSDEGGCLNLNVWAPAATDSPAPVMAWIHGGAFVTGSGSDPMFDGTNLARRFGVVIVTINYRLGALGFTQIDDDDHPASGNAGLMDQIAALRWVATNIAGFGGDPANVTVVGQSAGAMSVACLMAMPDAQGLFRRAIMQSGSGEFVRTRDQAADTTRQLLGILGVTQAQLPEVPVAEIIAAQAELMAAPAPDGGLTVPFGPVIDKGTLPQLPVDAARSGRTAGIPLLIGSNAEEARLFRLGAPPGASTVDSEVLAGRFAAYYRDGAEALRRYRRVEADTSNDGLATALLGRQLFQDPTERFASAHTAQGGSAFRYLLTWRSPAHDLGACHSLDLPFMFDNLDQPGAELFTGGNPPRRLADTMASSWTSFARTGRPAADWPGFDVADRATAILDDAGLTVRNDPLAPLRNLPRRDMP